MKVSYSWLKEMVDLPVGPDELEDILTYLGLEVEARRDFQPYLEKVVTGKVIACDKIEGSDYLSMTRVDVGGEVLPVVCGAPNVRTGMIGVVMLPGSVTAAGQKVKKAKLRGQESLGMLAAEDELGLSDDHTGIIEGDAFWQSGADASLYLNYPDTVFEVEVTPNRPDYLSHVGIARDLAAKFRLGWKPPDYKMEEESVPASEYVFVDIEAPQACPRYAARVIRNVSLKPSPYHMRLKLTRCGVRPISNIVDVTNYLMLEFGQPLHAFDERFVADHYINVRMAAAGESFVTLDGEEHQLNERDLLIADSEKGIALAGIMGGLNSEIRDDTSSVIIECAYFDPVHIRRSAKHHGMATESSRRFERGMDPNGVEQVIDATAALMQTLSGGNILSGRVDVYPDQIEPRKIRFRPARVSIICGIEIPEEEIRDTFIRLGCAVEEKSSAWEVLAPTWRPDLEREIDLVEEAIRVHGYDSIPAAVTSRVALQASDDPMEAYRRRIVDLMVNLGFQETLSVSMYTPDERRDPPDMPEGVELANPVTDDMQRLHGSLLPHLIRAASANWQRGDRSLRLFEVAKVFHAGSGNDPRTWERQTLAAVMTGNSYPEAWAHPSKLFDFHDLKGVIEVLCTKISLDKVRFICYDVVSGELLKGEIKAGDHRIGYWGIWDIATMSSRDIDAPVGWFELDLSETRQFAAPEFKYSPLPKYPASWRDIAVVVEETVPAEELLATVAEAGGKFLSGSEPIDVYRSEKIGRGKKSIAIRMEFSHPDRSLETDEIEGWVQDVIKAVSARHKAVLR